MIIVSTKIYDNHDDFDFEIVNFPFTDGTQHERNYPVAPAPMPGSPIQLLTELCVA